MVRFRNTPRLNRSGFTLVELLIVVAIIGVLSTIGVPTFKRMVQKSKKSEAKVSLGGLYTSEQAFFAEYGAYGNMVTKIGYETDGTSNIYTVGFPTTGCVSQGARKPAAAGSIGSNLNLVYPSYFLDPIATSIPASVVMTSGCVAGDVTNSAAPGAEADLFSATATGVIAPGVSKTAPPALKTDVWTINNNRTMVNLQDGVQ